MVCAKWAHTHNITCYQIHMFYARKGRAIPGNLHFAIFNSSCYTFHHPKRAGGVKLKSAASGSWTSASGVSGKCVTIRPPALFEDRSICSSSHLTAFHHNRFLAVQSATSYGLTIFLTLSSHLFGVSQQASSQASSSLVLLDLPRTLAGHHSVQQYVRNTVCLYSNNMSENK